MPAPEATVTQGLTSDFPSDFPVYPEATPGGAIGLGKGPMIVSFTTDASVGDVVTFYDSQLKSAGWSVENSDVRLGTLNASKGRRTAVVRANTSPGGTTTFAIVLEGS